MNYQKAANLARTALSADSTPTSSAQVANGLIDVVRGRLSAYIDRAAATLGRLKADYGLKVTGDATVTGNLTVNGTTTSAGAPAFSVANALSANSGGIQSGATAINKTMSRFTTVGGAGYSAVLPAAVAGDWLVVVNDTDTSMNVFPNGTDAINALSASAAFALPGRTSLLLTCEVAAQWNTFSSATTMTGTGANVRGTAPSIASPVLTTTVKFPAVNTAVAAAGSTNSDAAALTSAHLQHVSSDSSAKGVKLPVGVAGDVIIIINDSATACKIYPDASGNVNGATATSGSVTVPASKGVIATCTVALTWIVYDLPAKSA